MKRGRYSAYLVCAFLCLSHYSCYAFILQARCTRNVRLSFVCDGRNPFTPAAKGLHRVEHDSTVSTTRRSTSPPSAHTGMGEEISCTEDPFRPTRAPLSPIVINALVRVLFHDVEAKSAAARLLEQRSDRNDWQLSPEEEGVVKARVCGVTEHVAELRSMLTSAIDR